MHHKLMWSFYWNTQTFTQMHSTSFEKMTGGLFQEALSHVFPIATRLCLMGTYMMRAQGICPPCFNVGRSQDIFPLITISISYSTRRSPLSSSSQDGVLFLTDDDA